MIILAIDPSTKSSGIAIFKDLKLICHTCIQASDSDVLKRIKQMVQSIEKIYLQYKPDKIILQQVLPQDVKQNQAVFKALIYLQAAIVLMLHNYQKESIITPVNHWRAQVGIHTGRGIKREALKQASQQLVKKKYNLTVNNDVADAICIGLSYINEHCSAF